MPKNDKTPNFDKMAKNNFIFNVSKPPVRFPKPSVTQKCLKMIKRRILVKWPKTTFFSCFEATCSISEAASDSKMSENDKAPNFDKMAKNNVFIHVSKPPVRFPKPPATQKCLKMLKRRILIKWSKTTFFFIFRSHLFDFRSRQWLKNAKND